MDEKRETKQIIVMRKDLNMRKGKMVAQGAHASLKAIIDQMVDSGEEGNGELTLYFEPGSPLDWWLGGSFAKVCVSVDSEEELMAIFNKAQELLPDAPAALVTDAGRTEFNGVPTLTCCAIGPWWSDEIDAITGELKLL